MANSPPAYLLSQSLIQSPVIDKYYLQLANHTLLDLIRQAIKNIIIFNTPLQELPIIYIQRQIYTIYDNTNINGQDIRQIVRHQFMEMAKLQKNFLEMSYVFLEKQKQGFSDMRQSNDDWSVSWNNYKPKNIDESNKKSYGVVANILCNNFNAFALSIKEVGRLLQHLYQQNLIPDINTEQMEDSIMVMITRLFLLPSFIDLHNVLPIMPPVHKYNFVYCSDYGIELRRTVTKFSQQRLPDLIRPKKDKKIGDHQKSQSNKSLKNLISELFLPQSLFNENTLNSLGQDNYQYQAEQQLELLSRFAPTTKSQQKYKQNLFQKQDIAKNINTSKVLNKEEAQTPKVAQSLKVDSTPKPILASNAYPTINTLINSNLNLNPNASSNSNTNISNGSNSLPIPQINKRQSESNKQPKKEIPLEEKPMKSQHTLCGKKTGKPILAGNQQQNLERQVQKKSQRQKMKEQMKVEVKRQEGLKGEKFQISSTKITLSSGTVETKMASFTFKADNPGQLSKELSQYARINDSILIKQLAAHTQVFSEQVEKANKVQNEEIDNQDKEEAKKKKKKNKKSKKNKKGEQCVEELLKAKIQTESSVSTLKSEGIVKQIVEPKVQARQDHFTQQEKALFMYLQSLQIDEKNRIQCKIDEQIIKKWRTQSQLIKKSFAK